MDAKAADLTPILYLDIETIPSGEMFEIELPKEPTRDDIKTGLRKKEKAEEYITEQLPKKIEEWEAECVKATASAEEKYRKRAVGSLTSTILCIGYAFGDGEPDVITGTEKEITQKLNSMLSRYGDRVFGMQVVGHNIIDFDLKFIFHRSIKYSQRNLTRILSGYSDYQGRNNLYDTMREWGLLTFREYTKLDDIAKYLGVTSSKGKLDGSKVYDFYKEGRLEEIYEYCKDDVSTTRDVYKRMIS